MVELSQEISIIIIATLFLTLVSVGIIMLVLVYQKKQIRNEKEKEKQIMESILETQEQTLKKVSQELHDNIGQTLTLVKLNMNAIDLDLPESAKEKLFESKSLLTLVIQDLRDLAKTLSTEFIDKVGLVNAIDQQLQYLRKSGLYSTHLSVKGDVCKYASQRELVIFRILQELLNNIVKHAEATIVDVEMEYAPDFLVIVVRDNGIGFNYQVQNLPDGKGFGLRNIHNRITLIKGTIQFQSELNKGTTATLEISR